MSIHMEKKIKQSDKKLAKHSFGMMRVQCSGNPENSSFMVGPNGAENVQILDLQYYQNDCQKHYTLGDEMPDFKFAYNWISQKAYLVAENESIKTFVLNNKERSAFDGLIIVTWISLYSQITYMVVMMGDGNDFGLFQGKCNGQIAKQIQRSLVEGGKKFDREFLNSYEIYPLERHEN